MLLNCGVNMGRRHIRWMLGISQLVCFLAAQVDLPGPIGDFDNMKSLVAAARLLVQAKIAGGPQQQSARITVGKRRQVARLMMVCFTPFCVVGFWRKQNDP